MESFARRCHRIFTRRFGVRHREPAEPWIVTASREYRNKALDSSKDRMELGGTADSGAGTIPPGRGPRSVRDAALQQGLRAAYRTVIEEPIPANLMNLLDQLGGDGPTR
jgi:hypothetical protein